MTAATVGARNPTSAAHPQTRDRAAHFGQAVRRRRKHLGLSQEKLAELAGCERQSVNRVENAAYSPSLHRLWKLADALGIRLEDLLHDASVTLTAQRAAERAVDEEMLRRRG